MPTVTPTKGTSAMNGIFSVVFEKDTSVAIFFTLDQAKDYAKWQAADLGNRFRLRVYGGERCYFDTNDK